MIKKSLIFFSAICILNICAVSQNVVVLSNDYLNPTDISVNTINDNINYQLVSDSYNDLEEPTCNRMYPGTSSYFSFKMPNSGISSVVVEVLKDYLFGIAVYVDDNNSYQELKCEIFGKKSQGIVTIGHDLSESIAEKEILVRVWLLDQAQESLLDISVFERPLIKTTETSELSIKDKVEMLEFSHKQFIDLPYSNEVIFNDIFPKIQEERLEIAPNFPNRGVNNLETRENQIHWLENYPDEFYLYLEFLDEKYQYYKKNK